jgi:hypothetical protein
LQADKEQGRRQLEREAGRNVEVMWPLIHHIRQRLMSGIGLIKPALGRSERYRIKDTAVIALTSIALLMALIDETPKAIRPLYWSLGATSAIAALAVGATIWLSVATQLQNDWVRHTLAVRNQIAQILSLVQSAQTGQRGYLLTNSQAYPHSIRPRDRGGGTGDRRTGRAGHRQSAAGTVRRTAPRTRQS